MKTRIGKVISDNFPSVNNFATKAQIPQGTIFKWKDLEDSTKPGIDLFIKFAELLPNLNLRWLITGEPNDSDSEISKLFVNEPSANYTSTASIKDSLIELQQKHIATLEREIERLTNSTAKKRE